MRSAVQTWNRVQWRCQRWFVIFLSSVQWSVLRPTYVRCSTKHTNFMYRQGCIWMKVCQRWCKLDRGPLQAHVIPCYPMSLVLVSRFNWFNVILCGLFFPALSCISRISISRISKQNHDMTWSLWQFTEGVHASLSPWIWKGSRSIFECRRHMPLEKYVENLKQSCNFQLLQRCCGTMWYPANHRCSSSPYSVLMLVPDFQHSEEFFADLLVNRHRFSSVWRPKHV